MNHFAGIDMAVVIAYVLICLVAGLWVRRYAGHLDNFIVAGRSTNVYIGVASLAATEFGLVTVMYTSQYGFTAGFSPILIGILYAVPMLIMGQTGFIVKRIRASGAATISEVLQQKFGPRIRWWSGLLVGLAGILNMGVFLRVGGEFVVTFTGIGDGALTLGGLRLGYLELIMTGLLAVTLTYTMAGGMLSVLVTDLIQFLFLGVGAVVITVVGVAHTGWGTLVAKVGAVHGEGGFNPFVSSALGGIPGILFWALVAFGAQCTWQTTISRVLACKDEETASSMYRWTGFYFVGRWALPIVWGIVALVILDPALFPKEDPVASRLAMPTALARIIPSGLAGLILAALLAAQMSTDSSYMLSWATVLVHDVVKPLFRNGLSSRAELALTRLTILLIGLFLLFFGLWYRIPGQVFNYLGLTASIYLSGMTTLVIAALYWPRASREGAGLALVLGSLSPLAWLVYDLLRRDGWPQIPDVWAGLSSFVLAAAGMLLGSWCSGRGRDA